MNTDTRRWTPITLLALAALASPASAQFNSGSTGAYGAMNITTNTTLNLPDDGVFHCTTVNVASGATLTFNKNALNTPVYILATGNVTIAGAINVNGKANSGALPGEGGPGGFRGGFGAVGNLPYGTGLGPGGAAGNAGNGTFYGVYGNAALIPLVGGSGGGCYFGNGGSGGGGAILIASNTQITITGSVSALRGSGNGYEGSAGAIRLVAPLVNGTGSVTVGSNNTGRIRIDTEDRLAWRTLTVDNVPGFAYGSRMAVFPSPLPRIDLLNVAGTAIAEGTTSAATITLPPGSSSSQNVQAKVSGMTGTVDVITAVIPENGTRVLTTTSVDMSGGGPVTIDVPVTIPVGGRVAIEVYKK